MLQVGVKKEVDMLRETEALYQRVDGPAGDI